MDIKAKIEEVVARIKEDKDFAAKFSKESDCSCRNDYRCRLT